MTKEAVYEVVFRATLFSSIRDEILRGRLPKRATLFIKNLSNDDIAALQNAANQANMKINEYINSGEGIPENVNKSAFQTFKDTVNDYTAEEY